MFVPLVEFMLKGEDNLGHVKNDSFVYHPQACMQLRHGAKWRCVVVMFVFINFLLAQKKTENLDIDCCKTRISASLEH